MCGGNGMAALVYSGVCSREGCGGVKVEESVYGMRRVRVG